LVDGTSHPTISRSGPPIKYSPPTNYPLIGYDAPTLADVAAGRKRKMISTKRTAQKTQVSSGPTLAITSAPDADVPTDAVSSPSEGNRQLLTFFFLTTTHTLPIISFRIPIIATEDTNEDDTQEVTSQTSPIVQVLRFVYLPLSDIYLIFVFFKPDPMLALQKGQNNCFTSSSNTITFPF